MHLPRPTKPALAILAMAATPLPLHLGSGQAVGSPPAPAAPGATVGAGRPNRAHSVTSPTAKAPTTSASRPAAKRPTTSAPGPAPAPTTSASTPAPARTGSSQSNLPVAPTKASTSTKPTSRASANQPANRPAARHSPRAAGDPGDTISDFQFSPATTTIQVGDTITWTNNGPSEHSATANNGSFDTGLLQKGASASHTFSQAGTFTYFCKVHPFMHGTVVVLAASTTTTPTSPATTPTTTAPAAGATTAASGPTLPMTGLALTAPLLSGLALLGIGVALRRRLTERGSDPRDS